MRISLWLDRETSFSEEKSSGGILPHLASQHLDTKAGKFKNALRGYMGETLISWKKTNKKP